MGAEELVGASDDGQARTGGTGMLGAWGCCGGGAGVNRLAGRRPDLAAAVWFYGAGPSAADVARIKAPLLIHNAGLDERINAAWPAFESALKANGVKHEMFVYPNANHGFHNHSTPRYDEDAATLAWSRT